MRVEIGPILRTDFRDAVPLVVCIDRQDNDQAISAQTTMLELVSGVGSQRYPYLHNRKQLMFK